MLIIPLMVRRESVGVVADSAVSASVLASLFVLGQVCAYMGQMQWVGPDVAAWIPVIAGGSWAAWLSGVIRS